MRFLITGRKSGIEASYQVDTAIEALANFHGLYELSYLNVRVRDRRGKRLSRDDLIRLVALQKIKQTKSDHKS